MAEKLQFENYRNEKTYVSPAEISAEAKHLIEQRNRRFGTLALKNVKY